MGKADCPRSLMRLLKRQAMLIMNGRVGSDVPLSPASLADAVITIYARAVELTAWRGELQQELERVIARRLNEPSSLPLTEQPRRPERR